MWTPNIHDERLYFTTDANFNVTAVVDTSGAVVERYAYDPYGQVTILNGADGADPDVDGETVFEWDPDADGASDVDNRTLYAGYHLDTETGLYSVRYRYYHPTLGRWLSRDHESYLEGMCLYEYCRGTPAGRVDPTGWVSFSSVAGSAFDAVVAGAEAVGDAAAAVGEAASNWIDQNVGNGPEMVAARWAAGQESRTYNFVAGDRFLEILRRDPFIEQQRDVARQELEQNCAYPKCSGEAKKDFAHTYETYLAAIRDAAYLPGQYAPYVPKILPMGKAGDTLHAGVQFVGGAVLPALGATKASAWLGRYQGKWEAKGCCCTGKAKMTFHVDDFFNFASLTSLRDIVPTTWESVKKYLPPITDGNLPEGGILGGKVILNFDWSDEIDFKPDPLCTN